MKARVKLETRMGTKQIDTAQLAQLWRTMTSMLGDNVRTHGELARKHRSGSQEYEVDTPEELERLEVMPGKGELRLSFLTAEKAHEKVGIRTREGVFGTGAGATDLVVQVEAGDTGRATAIIDEARRWKSANVDDRRWRQVKRITANAAVSAVVGGAAAASGHYDTLGTVIMTVVDATIVYALLSWIQHNLPASWPSATEMRIRAPTRAEKEAHGKATGHGEHQAA